MSELACIIACTVHYWANVSDAETGLRVRVRVRVRVREADLKPCAELTLGTFFPSALPATCEQKAGITLGRPSKVCASHFDVRAKSVDLTLTSEQSVWISL